MKYKLTVGDLTRLKYPRIKMKAEMKLLTLTLSSDRETRSQKYFMVFFGFFGGGSGACSWLCFWLGFGGNWSGFLVMFSEGFGKDFGGL